MFVLNFYNCISNLVYSTYLTRVLPQIKGQKVLNCYKTVLLFIIRTKVYKIIISPNVSLKELCCEIVYFKYWLIKRAFFASRARNISYMVILPSFCRNL